MQLRARALAFILVVLTAASGLHVARAHGQTCPGDCNRDHSVAVDELVLLVDVALGSAPTGACTGSSHPVDINDIVAAVDASLNGCPAPTGDATAALAVVRGLAQLPGLSDAISVALDGYSGSTTCELGGTLATTCEDPGTGSYRAPVAADHCRVSTLEGPIDYDGTVIITTSGQCPGLAVQPGTRFTFSWDAITETGEGAPLITARFDNTLTLQGFIIGPAPCHIKGGAATLDGSIVYTGAEGHQVTVQLDHVDASTQFLDFEGSCDPITVVMVLNGSVRIDDTYGDGPFGLDVFLDGVTLTIHRDSRLLEIHGVLDSACFGGSAEIKTVEPLAYPLDRPCFTGGTLAVGTGRVSIAADAFGGVQVGRLSHMTAEASYDSCLDLPRAACE